MTYPPTKFSLWRHNDIGKIIHRHRRNRLHVYKKRNVDRILYCILFQRQHSTSNAQRLFEAGQKMSLTLFCQSVILLTSTPNNGDKMKIGDLVRDIQDGEWITLIKVLRSCGKYVG